MSAYFVGADSETHLFRPGWTFPRQVCTTLAVHGDDFAALREMINELPTTWWLARNFSVNGQPFVGVLLDRAAAAAMWPVLLADPDVNLVFHNAPFDVLGATANFPDVTRAAQKAAEEGRIWDTSSRERLVNNAHGSLKWQIDPFTKKLTDRGVYTLSTLVGKYLKVDLRDEKTDLDAWRLRYAELDGKPVADWPDAAVEYAMMDAVYPLPVLQHQDEALPPIFEGLETRCWIWPDPVKGIRRFAGEYHLVIGGLAFNAASGWGLRTNPQRVAETLAAWKEDEDRGRAIGQEAGFVREDGSRNMKLLAELVSQAYKAPVDLHLAENLFEAQYGRKPESKDDLKQAKAEYRAVAQRDKRTIIKKTCERLGLDDPDLYTDTGKIATRHDVLATADDPVLRDYSECTAASKYRSLWEHTLLAGTRGPVTYRIDPLKSTGRISIWGKIWTPEGEGNTLYHQIPRKGRTREAHEPRPGCVYVMADYDQLELRAMAQLQVWLGLGGSLLDVFLKDKDPHVMVAVELLNADHKPGPRGGAWSYEDGVEARTGAHGPEAAKLLKQYRQLAKAANFGLLGGLGAPTFIKFCRASGIHGLDIPAAQRVIDVWRQVFPSNAAYLDYIKEKLPFGTESAAMKQFCSGRVRGNVRFTSMANSYFQGLAADGFASAAWLLFKGQHDPDSLLFGARTVIPLHDEFILEAPEARARDAARGLEVAMIEGMGEAMPDVPVRATAAISRIWSKDVEPVYNEAGELIPWEER